MALAQQELVGYEAKSAGKPLSYRWHATAAEIPQECWNRCFPDSVEGLFWYQTLEQCELSAQFNFQYLLVFDEQGPAAIAPVFIMEVPLQIMAPVELEKLLNILARVLPRLTKIRTVFIGSPCADEGTVGIIPGRNNADVYQAVNQAVKQLSKNVAAGMIVWKDFNEQASQELAQQASDWNYLSICSYPGTELHVPSGDFANYLATLKKSRRQNLKRKLETSRKTGELKAETVSELSEPLLQEIFPLFWQTYEKGTTKFEQLNKEFFRKIALQKQSRFLLLRDQQGKLLAFRLFFHLDGKIVNKFIGIDYAANSQYFPLFKLVEEGILYALRHNVPVIQSGQTGYGAKMETGHKLVPLYNFIWHRNPIGQWLLKLATKAINWTTLDPELTEYLAKHPEALPPIAAK